MLREQFKLKNPVYHLLQSAKSRAKKKNVPFNLKIEDIIIPQICPVLGIEIKQGQHSHNDHSPTIDRVVPEKGYVKENIRIISLRANTIKSMGNAEEHEKIAKYIRENTPIS